MFAFVCHPYHRGGVTRWMIDAAIEVARRGHEAVFVAPRPTRPFVSAGGQPPVVDVLAATDVSRRVVCVTADVGSGYEFGTSAYRASVLFGTLRRSVASGTTLIPSDDGASWAAACAAPAEYPVIGVLHADDEHYYALAERHHGEVAGFVCVSARIEDKLKQRLPALRVPVRRIPCGIPLGSSPPAVRETSSTVRIAWAGRIEERQKRVFDLARILEALLAEGIDASLEILGDGPDRRALEQEFSTRGVGSRVTWRGWLSSDQVREHLARADVFLLPSNFEGMPVAAMEGLASGCGIAASDRTGLEELARHADSASCLRIFGAGDVTGAVHAIRSLIAVDAATRVRRAHSLAASEFSIETCVSRYEELATFLARPRPLARPAPVWARAAWITSLPIAAVRRARVWLSQVLPIVRSARGEAA